MPKIQFLGIKGHVTLRGNSATAQPSGALTKQLVLDMT